MAAAITRRIIDLDKRVSLGCNHWRLHQHKVSEAAMRRKSGHEPVRDGDR